MAVSKLPYSRKELLDPDIPAYTGEALKMISFPLGGIGTGTIGLGGRGELRDWEVYNNPNLGYRPPYTMPYLFCKQGNKTIARVLERQLLPPHHASGGIMPETQPGLPRLKEAVFVGTYPMARVMFEDSDLPVEVMLEGYNPMIPGNAEDSAIPAGILTYRLTNRTTKPVSGSLALSMANTVGLSADEGLGQNVNACRQGQGVRGVYMTGKKYAADHVGYGTMALTTNAASAQCITEFDEPGWWDKSQKIWDAFSQKGRLDGPAATTEPSVDGATRVGMIAVDYQLKPRQSTSITFFITWCFPQRPANWFVHVKKLYEEKGQPVPSIRNHYADKFPDAWAAAEYLAANLPRLRQATLTFEQTLFDTTLPGIVLDAVSSQMAIIRTNTTMWLNSPPDEKAGRIFGFEGCNPKAGCCAMNCTHVWNYEQSMAHLYPSLERSMRLSDYTENMHDQGAMAFRTAMPVKLSLPLWNAKVCAADGQFGTVVKTYREWRISGDTEWLRQLWPAVKESIEFAWKGYHRWDADKDGMMEGIQHNTYDIDFHGPNTMSGSLYLAALTAGAEMARALGENDTADEYMRIFESGRKKYDQTLFNGEFYEQKVTETKEDYKDLIGNVIKAGRPKYQQGYGCLSDQLLGQWAAHVAGLGYMLSPKNVRKAMASIFKYNFKSDLSRHECCQRVYALNDEGGLLACTWPNGKREKFPFPYSDEVWTGIEYQVAAGLIYEGMIDEGLTIVTALRTRHDGVARNPWDEFECGDHYARAMSSWSVMLALAGQRYDGRNGELTMKPLLGAEDFKCLYTGHDAYGMYAQKLQKGAMTVTVDCRSGQVKLGSLQLAWPKGKVSKLQAAAKFDGKSLPAVVAFSGNDVSVTLVTPVVLQAGQSLSIVLK